MDQGIVGVVDQPVGGVVDARILEVVGVQRPVAPVLTLGEQVVKTGPLGKAGGVLPKSRSMLIEVVKLMLLDNTC